jgi:hypothetical protein
MFHENVETKKKTKSLQFLVEALTKPGSFIDAYACACEFSNIDVDFKH